MPHRNRRMSKKIGLKPGALVYVGEQRPEKVTIDVIDYDESSLTERRIDDSAELRPYRDSKTMTWINVNGIHDIEIMKGIGEAFGLHELVLEDILNTAQRPKIEEWPDSIFLVAKMLALHPDTREIVSEQVSIVFGAGWVLSFQEREGDVFGPFRDRLRKTVPRVRSVVSDYVAYALLDAVVDHYFLILETYGDQVEDIEDRLVANPTERDLSEIYALRRELVAMRKRVWPLRDVVGGLNRSELPLLHDGTKPYIRDLYEHVIQVIDTLETYRETASSLLDVYLSSVSNRMNEVMKVLTIIATIFIPLSFLAGVYGMNFDTGSPFNMPELSSRFGYFGFWLVALVVGIGLLIFFKRKRWM